MVDSCVANYHQFYYYIALDFNIYGRGFRSVSRAEFGGLRKVHTLDIQKTKKQLYKYIPTLFIIFT